MSYQNFLGYAGDILAVDTYALLRGDSTSILIDVRTQAEWTYVGTPDIQAIGKMPLFLEWQSYPSMAVDTDFTGRLEELLQSGGVERGASLLFLCRSGARSRHAATAMTSAGWAPCFNVSDGFEGALGDDSRQRGRVSGWKAGGLPWTQT
jgi:rhodanese-related sulfurtransferase